MLVAAALIPDTALLVPGAGGVGDPGAALREAALAAMHAALIGGSWREPCLHWLLP